jgi:hypothetical protein
MNVRLFSASRAPGLALKVRDNLQMDCLLFTHVFQTDFALKDNVLEVAVGLMYVETDQNCFLVLVTHFT